jgi:nucleoid DNA-binding protein
VQAEKMKTKKGKKKKQTAGLSKRDLHRAIAERTGLSKKRVTDVFAALEDVLADQMKTDGGGEFTLPGLAKFTTSTRPAVKARRGINPFTGEETVFAARPESRTVKIRALKKLKGFANS